MVQLTRLYNWYGADFEQVAGSILNFAARYSPPLKGGRSIPGTKSRFGG